MIRFSDDLELKLFEVLNQTHPNDIDIINEKRFRVSDTSISYRQINSLDQAEILSDKRTSNKLWRKFSIKDLIFFEIIKTCRKIGLNNIQIKDLSDCFYLEQGDIKDQSNSNSLHSDLAIQAVLHGQSIFLIITPEWKAYFTDFGHFSLLEMEYKSFIYINFNEIVINIFNNVLKVENNLNYKELFSIFAESVINKLNGKEREILNIIRNKDYSLVTIKKKGDTTFNVYGESQKEASNLSEKDLLKLFEQKDFSNIKIQKRDGKIVNYLIEDVYKI